MSPTPKRTLLTVALALLALTAGCQTDSPADGSAASSPTAPSSSARSSSGSASGSAPASTPAPSGDQVATPPAPPRAGACYRLTYDQALAPTSHRRPVSCKHQHTATTYFVGELQTVVDGHLLAVDAGQVQAQVAAQCPARLASYVGAKEAQLRLSTLRSVWFSPTLGQSDRGANWFRCDVIALGADGKLAPLETSMAKALATGAGRDRFGVCGTTQPGRANFEQVICSATHSWRAISAYDVSGKTYPGAGAIRGLAADPCQAAAKARAADPLDYQWGFDWPTPRQWSAGQHYGLCWAPD